ncbi:MAG TPA: anthranilate synthase component I [Candidatus Hydrogenedentes bacterium]|nr:anthranilate synthase component I [Candidatus Hydrogenedentota bacterium]
MIHPNLETFRKLARPGALVPIYREILGDLETPVTAYLKASRGQQYSFLLESVEKADQIGQYSFLGANPTIIFKSRGREVSIVRRGVEERFESDNPLRELEKLMAGYDPVAVDGLPPFHGGAVGYMSYDQVRFFERLPDKNPDLLGLPDLYFMITDTIVVFNHVKNKIQIVSNVHVGDDPEAAYNDGARKIHELEARLRGPLTVTTERVHSGEEPPLTSNFSREEFCAAVRAAKEYICAGDIFQVVLSQRFARPVSASPANLYRALRCINPSPYMLLLQYPEAAIVGSSPEVMTQVMGKTCMVRPIAGTRPRGANAAEDLALEHDLMQDEKERAEHIMLVDLGRNDVGRVSAPGSVAPVANRFMVVERYSHVMHIVTEVAGVMKDGCNAFDALEATFPMGTVSGAPKIRAMEIIDELENVRRGPYSGGAGYVSFGGDMDTCILIRTMVVKDGVAHLQAGAGIVYDSDPDREYDETVNKVKALFRAVEFAERGLES